MGMIQNVLKRYANRSLQKQVDRLSTELEAEKRKLIVANEEIKSLAAVIVRDRSRIQSETASYQRRRAEAEGTDGRINQSTS